MHSKGWISQRALKSKEESNKLGVKKFNRIKSNNSLKPADSSMKSTSSYKAFGPKGSSDTTKNSAKSNASKRNKSYDYFNKAKDARKSSKDKEFCRVKEYVQSKNIQKLNEHKTQATHAHKMSKRDMIERLALANNSTNISTSEESKIMQRKKLSIQIPDSEEENANPKTNDFVFPKDMGPHRSVSVQNRTTTITQFSSLTPKEEDKPLNFVTTRVEEDVPLKCGKDIIVPNFEQTKTSIKGNGVVAAYAANTHQGIVRNYNEDRVSIILNCHNHKKDANNPVNPRKDEVWPKCSFFGIYDGHGGNK